jgi:triosephosphate isomerase
MKRFLVLGNWKCHGTPQMVAEFRDGLNHPPPHEDLGYGLSLPFHLLAGAGFPESLMLGGQDVSPFSEGAFTGEISAGMLAASGCSFCLVGHSERRLYFGETVKDTATKILRLLAAGIMPVLCIGESLEEREGNRLRMVLREQLSIIEALPEDAQLAVAYEPVWAIGTGVAATAKDVKEAHFLIKRVLTEESYGSVPVLYGGSVKPGNAASLAEIGLVDGFLIGGASLKPDDFGAILRAFRAGKQL